MIKMGTFHGNNDYNTVEILAGSNKMNLRKPPHDSIFNLKFEMTVYVKIPSGINTGNGGITNLYCYICSKEIYDFLDHMKQYHEKAFLCGICGVFFRSNYDLTNHVKNKCLLGRYSNANKLRKSNSMHFNSAIYDHSKYDCKYCRKKFHSSTQLKAHSKIHSSRLVYKCTAGGCDRFFKTKALFDKHLKSKCGSMNLSSKAHGQKIVIEKELLQCFICDNDFPSVNHLKTHLMTHKSENHDIQNEMNKFQGLTNMEEKYLDSRTKTAENDKNQLAYVESRTSVDFEQEATENKIYEVSGESENDNITNEIKLEICDTVDGKNECVQTFTCDLCNSVFESDSELKCHKLLTHQLQDVNPSYYHCEHCGESFTEHDQFVQHLKQHSLLKNENLNCKECSKSFHSQKSWKSHLKKVHHLNNTIYECDTCQKKFKDESVLKKHMNSKHTEQKQFCCDECGTTFTHIKPLQKHLKMHIKEPSYECDICNAKFKKASALKSHITYRHTDEKPFSCEQCGHSFKRKFHLNEHVAIHTGETQHKCDDCGKCFRTKSSLRSHVKMHTSPEKMFICSVCGRSFYSAAVLKSHIFTHSGEKPFSCTVCEKRFNRNANLMQHLRIHTGEKPYTCDVCGNSFNHVGTFKKHKLLHTDEKPHTCPTCGRNFRSLGNMTKHMWTHSGVKPYECQECGKKFRQNHHLTAHKTTHLPKEKRNLNQQDDICQENSNRNVDYIVQGINENGDFSTMIQLQPVNILPQTMVITPGLVPESISLISEQNDSLNPESLQKYMYNL